MKLSLTLCTFLTPLLLAKEIPAPAKKATDFLRVEHSEDKALLQPAASTYKKDDIKVTLLGAVHIADKAYYTDLNKRFKTYDRLLFEMIGGDQLPKIQKREAMGKKTKPSTLGRVYQMASSFLDLTDQKTEIDYTAENFVHADLTHNEYQKLQDERDESLLGFALEAAQEADPANEPSTVALMAALLTGNSNKVKLLLIDSLAGGDEAMSGLAKPSVIITDRNAKALKVLDARIKAGDRNLGIFYGAAHFPDLEKSLLKMGYKKTKQEWLTAWSVPKK